MFAVYGSLGFIWLVFWHKMVHALPTSQLVGTGGTAALAAAATVVMCGKEDVKEKSVQPIVTGPPAQLLDVPLGRFCRSKAVWAIAM